MSLLRQQLFRSVPAVLALTLLVPAAASAASPAFVSPGSASAARASRTDSRTSALDDAKSKAAALRRQVEALQLQAELATERYDAATTQLGHLVTEQVSAQEQLDAANYTAGDRSRTADARLRGLYETGGTPALYAAVLQGTSITDVLDRLVSVQAVVGGDRSAVTAATRSVARQQAAAQRLAVLTARQSALAASVADRADQVRALLGRTQQLLDSAGAEVRRLAEEQARAAAAAAAAKAAAELAAARAAAQNAQNAQSALNQRSLTLAGPVAAPNPVAAAAIAEAERHLGEPYLWGGTGPVEFDCSGLTQYAYRAAGLQLPRVAAAQFQVGPQVALGDLQPGDLLFWATDVNDPATVHHVAMYLGNGQMIAAPHTGTVIQIQPVYLDGYIGATRPSAAVAQAAPTNTPVPTG